MGQTKRNNPLRRFCIFFILTCSFLFTAFFPIPFSQYLSANAQLLSVSNLSSPLVVDSSCLLFTATSVLEYRPGTKNNGIPIEPPHDNPDNAIGFPEGSGTPNYVSLGLHDPGEDTGTIILGIDPLPEEYAIVQLEVVDEQFGIGNCTDSPENIAVSIADDMGSWQSLGTGCQTHTFSVNPPLAFRYVRIQDISDRTLFPEGEDGYDLDGIVVTACRINPTPTLVITPTFVPTDSPTVPPPLPTETPTATLTMLPTSTLTEMPTPTSTATSGMELPPSPTFTPTGTSSPTLTAFVTTVTPSPTANITATLTISPTSGSATAPPIQPAITITAPIIVDTPNPSGTFLPEIPSGSSPTPVGPSEPEVEPSDTPPEVSIAPTNTSAPPPGVRLPLVIATSTPPAWLDGLSEFSGQVAIEVFGNFVVAILYIEFGAIIFKGIMMLLNNPRNPGSINHFIDTLVRMRVLSPSTIRDIVNRLGDYERNTRDLLDSAIHGREHLLVTGNSSLPELVEIQAQISMYNARLEIIDHLKRLGR